MFCNFQGNRTHIRQRDTILLLRSAPCTRACAPVELPCRLGVPCLLAKFGLCRTGGTVRYSTLVCNNFCSAAWSSCRLESVCLLHIEHACKALSYSLGPGAKGLPPSFERGSRGRHLEQKQQGHALVWLVSKLPPLRIHCMEVAAWSAAVLSPKRNFQALKRCQAAFHDNSGVLHSVTDLCQQALQSARTQLMSCFPSCMRVYGVRASQAGVLIFRLPFLGRYCDTPGPCPASAAAWAAPCNAGHLL